MFSQRQWDELNAFTASFGSNNGGTQTNSQSQPQGLSHAQAPTHHEQQHQQQQQHEHQHFSRGDVGSQHLVNHQHHQQPETQAQPQFIQQPQPQYQQPEQLPFQYDFSPQQEWPRFGFDQGSTSGNAQALQHLSRQSDFGASSGDMDWTPSSEFTNSFQQGFDSNHYSHSQQPEVKMETDNVSHSMDSYSHNGNQGSEQGRGIGGLIARFENKEFQPPLPPRPNNSSIDNSVTSPIAINQHQQPSHFHHFNNAPQGHSFASNSFTSNSFVTNHVNTPSDTQFASFGTPHSRVASPMATSPGPAPFGSFHEGSIVGSPSTAPTSDPFGSLDSFVNPRMGQQMSHGMPQSPAPSTPGHPAGTPGFAMWRAPGQEQSGTPQGYEQYHSQSQFPFQQQQPPPQQAQNLQRPMSRQHSIATSPGGYMPPPVPPKVKPASGANQFILELNPGAKGKGKAPLKPPKPKAPKPSLTDLLPNSAPIIKQEPQTPQAPPTPTVPEVAPKPPETPSESSTPRPSIINRPSREQVPAESWESWKPTIHDLYLEQRKPLKEVMSIMAEQYNFQATPKMYKTRFSQWGFVKNNTEDEVKKLLSMKFQRDSQGKVSEFVRNGKIVNLGTYLKRKGVTEYDLVDFELPANLPSHIRCRTPTPPPAPEYLKSPDLVRAQETIVSNIRKAFLQCRQWELETERHVGWPSTMVWGAPSSEMLTEANFYFEASDTDSGGQCLMNAFNQLEIDLKQLSPQAILEVLFGMVKRDPGLMTALCKYVGAFSTTNYDRAHPLRQIFTCLYEVQQKHGAATLSDLLWGSSPLIAEELESIYGRRHPYVARTWIDMAIFYEQKTPEHLEKLAQELRMQHRQMDQTQGTEFSDLLALRYAIAQLLYAADPEADSTKQAANDLLKDMKKAKLLHRVRGSSKNTYCYHCAVKNDPWTKRCRRRYDSIAELLEKHTNTKVLPYFEEDFHTTEHEPESQPQQATNAWAAAMGMGSNKWGFL